MNRENNYYPPVRRIQLLGDAAAKDESGVIERGLRVANDRK